MARDQKLSADDTVINSIIGEGTHFRGNLELSGLLRIDGDFSGGIKTSGKVIIGKSGRADCSIDAGTVVVGGAVRGEIHAAEKVIVLASSLVLGDITAPRLIAEDGVVLDGTIRVSGGAPVSPTQQPKKRFSFFTLDRDEQDDDSEHDLPAVTTGSDPVRTQDG